MAIETVEQLIEWMVKMSTESAGSKVYLIVEHNKYPYELATMKMITNARIGFDVPLTQFKNEKAITPRDLELSKIPICTINMNVIIREIEEAITKKREEYRENQKQRAGSAPDPTREGLPGTETPGGQERQ